jgi:hypothetical protein
MFASKCFPIKKSLPGSCHRHVAMATFGASRRVDLLNTGQNVAELDKERRGVFSD